jgi:signal transduction histidine kinase
LTSEIAIGIRNAQSYTALRKLSAELEQRVLDRTRELEESQAKALAKAQEVVRLKDEFVFLAAHELRTPITAIRGFLELTTDEMDKFPKDIQDNLLAISGASDHLNQMISDLLEIARSENGTASLAAKPTEFKPILDQVLAGLSSLIAEKDIALTVQMSPLPPVLCDTSKTREVLINLIGNAIKYNREHGIIEITVYCPPGERFMMFEVRDNGYGIPKDQQAKIFQKFFRAVSKKTEDILGTGLGLFITRMLVERMGGKINFTSSGEMGTTFSFTLPLA